MKNKIMQKITGHTTMTCLLGSPVAHSISPMMHNEAFSLLGLDYVYLAFDVGKESLETVVSAFRKMNVRGFNLTMPDKVAVCELCDELSDAAKLIGAVNTVVNENNHLVGHNTDGIGYMRALSDAGFSITGGKMTLLGAGGAATAVCVQAAIDGVKEISIFNRKSPTFERAEALAQRVMEHTDCKVRVCDIEDTSLLADEIAGSTILTNGTSLGMAPNEDTCPIPDASMLRKDLIVSDLIYNPRQTKLLSMANQRGAKTCNGLYMLLYQGAEAFRLWTGKEMPVEQIKEKYFKA